MNKCNDNLAGIGDVPLNNNNILLKQFDLFIWDFDDTLIDTRAYLTRSMKPDDIRRRTDKELTEDIIGWQYFKTLCNYLVYKGKRVGIASFGTYEIIQAYMDRIFGFNQKIYTRNNIKTIMRDCWGNPVEFMRNKNKFIHELMTLYQLRDTNRVMLLDDRIENCADASNIGVVAIKIQGRDDNSIEGVGQFFNRCTVERIEHELTGLCSSKYIKTVHTNISSACNPNIQKKTNIIPIIEGFENHEETKYSESDIVLILLISIFIILGIIFISNIYSKSKI
jgi:hypothetical protein